MSTIPRCVLLASFATAAMAQTAGAWMPIVPDPIHAGKTSVKPDLPPAKPNMTKEEFSRYLDLLLLTRNASSNYKSFSLQAEAIGAYPSCHSMAGQTRWEKAWKWSGDCASCPETRFHVEALVSESWHLRLKPPLGAGASRVDALISTYELYKNVPGNTLDIGILFSGMTTTSRAAGTFPYEDGQSSELPRMVYEFSNVGNDGKKYSYVCTRVLLDGSISADTKANDDGDAMIEAEANVKEHTLQPL